MPLYRYIFYYALCFLRYHYFYLGQFIKGNYMEVPMLPPRLQLAELDENIMLTRTHFAVHQTILFGGGRSESFSFSSSPFRYFS